MRIAIGCDEQNIVIDMVQSYVKELGHDVVVSTIGHWAEVAKSTVRNIGGEADMAIVMCWSGTGVCMAANKIKGIRAALCWDAETARLARKWNDANVLCLSQRWTSETVAIEIVEAFLNGSFDEEGLGQTAQV